MPTVFDLCFSRFRRYYQGAEGCFRVLMPAFEAISWFCYQWVTIHFRSVETESAGKAPGLLIATDLQGNLTAWRTKCEPRASEDDLHTGPVTVQALTEAGVPFVFFLSASRRRPPQELSASLQLRLRKHLKIGCAGVAYSAAFRRILPSQVVYLL